METRPDTIVTSTGRHEIVETELDVAPAPGRAVTYTVTDRFLVVTDLQPAPPANHPHAALVGRIWPATGTVEARVDGERLVLRIDHGRVYAREYHVERSAEPEAARP